MELVSKTDDSTHQTSTPTKKKIKEGARHYIECRLSPKLGDGLYLHLSDLLLAIKSIATNDQLKILDYGADLSPYRSLFPKSEYLCADIEGSGTKDYTIGIDGTIIEEDQSFDLILSTQVAEHLPNPNLYFSECFRLLKPGGRLFISTHGSFEDHAFPNDFQRWTVEGIKRDLETADFEVISLYKMTSGPRAALHHIERCLETTFISRKTFTGISLWVIRKLHRLFRPVINKIADNVFVESRLVQRNGSSADLSSNMYIGVASIAQRPSLNSLYPTKPVGL